MKIQLADNFRKNMLREESEGKLEIIKCNKCKDGLSGTTKLKEGGYNWTGGYCEDCKGTGIFKVKLKTEDMFLCPKCEGFGLLDFGDSCDLCKGDGFIDWVTYMIKGKVNIKNDRDLSGFI